MGLPKGRTNNKAGKPRGAVNRLTRDTRQTITDFLERSWPEVEREFHKLKGRDKLNFYRDLLQYSIPKMQAVSMDIEFDNLSEEALDGIAFRLYNKKFDNNEK